MPLETPPLRREDGKPLSLKPEAIVHLDRHAAHAYGAVVLTGTPLFAALLIIIAPTEQLAKQTVFSKQAVKNAADDPLIFLVFLLLRTLAATVAFAARSEVDATRLRESPHATGESESWKTSHIRGSLCCLSDIDSHAHLSVSPLQIC